MGQVLHGSATTTAAIRRAMLQRQAVQANLRPFSAGAMSVAVTGAGGGHDNRGGLSCGCRVSFASKRSLTANETPNASLFALRRWLLSVCRRRGDAGGGAWR